MRRALCLLPLVIVAPSVIWIALDNSVWMWDQSIYGKGSVELFYAFIRSPGRWLRTLYIPQSQAPGISWLGEFFVPLGIFVGSIDVGLLLSIILTQAVTLLLVYRAVLDLSDRNEPVAIVSCLAMASAPLFVAMSHQYLTEPLQLCAITWFLSIMCFAPKWNKTIIAGQLLMAAPVAMLAKVSSPLYCVGPALIALWYFFRPAPASKQGRASRTQLVLVFVGALLLNLAAFGWYSRNIARVIEHVSVASFGPIAEIYGKSDTFLNTLTYWLEAMQNGFFLPIILILIGLLGVSAATVHLMRRPIALRHFSVCALVSLCQILIVLVVFSFSSSGEVRYLLPVLPYIAVVISWSLARIGSSLVTRSAALLFLAQLMITYGQAFGLIGHFSTTPGWLVVPNRVTGQKEGVALNAIIAVTCTDIEAKPYLNLVGIEKPWLNEHSANYLAAKNRVLGKPVGCRYGSFGYENDPEKIWNHLISNIRYYITLNPDSNPVPLEDAHLAAINLNYLPTLERVQNSVSFELQPALLENPAVLIFRRKERLR